MIDKRWIVSAAFSMLLAAGCAGNMTAPAENPDGGACSLLALDNVPAAQGTQVAGDRPVQPAGGAIVDGTYFATSSTIYTGTGGATGPLGAPVRAVMRIANGVYETRNDSAYGNNDGAGNISTSGTNLTLSLDCPTATNVSTGYTADANTISFFVDVAGIHSVAVWTKQ